MRGRKSERKGLLLRIYWNLRVSMEVEEIIEVLKSNPSFEDPDESTKDVEIKRKIVHLTRAMDSVLTMGKEEAIPFEDHR